MRPFSLGTFSKTKPLITFHSQADLDAVASACALHLFLSGSKIAMQDSMDAEARKFAAKMGIQVGTIAEAGVNSSSIILLDCNSRALVPNLKAKKIDLIIDHHSRHSDAISAKKAINDQKASSTCEIIYSLIPASKITRKIAICLLAGIISDSAHLRSARAETFSAVSSLLKKANLSYQEMLNFIHVPTDISQRFEMMRAMKGIEFSRKGNYIIATAIVNSFEAHVASSLVHVGADFAFVAHKGREDLRISARVSGNGKGKIDLAEIMQRISLVFGGSGGGHPYAAGYDGKCPEKAQEALDLCKELVLEKIGKST